MDDKTAQIKQDCEEIKRTLADGHDFVVSSSEAIALLDILVELYERNRLKKKVMRETLDWLNSAYGQTVDTDRSNEIRRKLAEAA